uniref:LAGLIDADG_2 domain-containing protein n=1 Tax=Steinernema glaseri TaxID=37863 RepID=A0A1I7Z3G5_9BILA
MTNTREGPSINGYKDAMTELCVNIYRICTYNELRPVMKFCATGLWTWTVLDKETRGELRKKIPVALFKKRKDLRILQLCRWSYYKVPSSLKIGPFRFKQRIMEGSGSAHQDNVLAPFVGIVVGDDGFIYANGDFRRKTNMHAEGF